MIEKHFAVFNSPGIIMSEQTTVEVDYWNIDNAIERARGIVERHGARPYGFFFKTKQLKDGEWEPSEVDRSAFYFLGGTVLTLEQVKARNNPRDRILISNMESNGYAAVVENTNSYTATYPLGEKDIVLDVVL